MIVLQSSLYDHNCTFTLWMEKSRRSTDGNFWELYICWTSEMLNELQRLQAFILPVELPVDFGAVSLLFTNENPCNYIGEHRCEKTYLLLSHRV